MPVSSLVNGNTRRGKTITEAIAKTKKSKNSEVRPMMTPMAISPGRAWSWPCSPEWRSAIAGICAVAIGAPLTS
ncbi:hypothetical protein ACVWW7_003280 [Bradyrhizobium sp. LM6.9]